MTNPFIDIINGNEESTVEVATIDESKRSKEEDKKLKLELFDRQKKIVDLKVENARLKYDYLVLEEKLIFVEKEYKEVKEKLAKAEKYAADKKKALKDALSKLPLKYMIVQFCRSIEREVELVEYFEKFGRVKKVTFREKGVEKWSKPYSSGVLEFTELNYLDFIDRKHTVRNQPLIIRVFDEEKDNIKETATGWYSDEFSDSSEHSKISKRHRRLTSRSPLPYDRNRRKLSRSPSPYDCQDSYNSSIDSQFRTRSILVRGKKYPRDPEEDFTRYFSKFGSVDKVSIRGPVGHKLTFVKFKDYESVDDAIDTSPHYISGISYVALPAKDM